MEQLSEYSRGVCEFLDEHKVAVTGAAAFAIGYLTFRRYMQGGQCRSNARLDGKTVLITGANTGIGLETAKDLAKRGARVLIACRSKERGEAALKEIKEYSGNNNVKLYILDLSSLQSVRDCAAEVLANEDRLDVLINNAGIMWMPQWKSKEGYDIQFATNHLGPFLLTNLLLDLIKKSAPSRIVNVSSVGHRRGTGMHFDDINLEKNFSQYEAYFQSKLANILFTVELSKRLKNDNVTANSLHPGAVATDLVRFMDERALPIRILFKALYYVAFKPFIKTPRSGAQTSIYLAVDPGVANISGKYFSDCAVDTPSKEAQDEEAAARLWKLSEQMVGLRQP